MNALHYHFLLARAVFILMACVGSLSVWAASINAHGLYQKHCSACHGERGNGHSRASLALKPPPRDFTSAEAWRVLSRERMLNSVRYGRPGTAMVGFDGRLNREQRVAIVDYIRRTFMHPPTIAQRSGGDALYREHCAVCHGDKGAGANWTRYSLNPAPRDFTAPESRAELNRERMLTSVTHGRPGTAMMSFSKRLTADQVATVVDYIRGTFMGLPLGGAVALKSARHGQTLPPAVKPAVAESVDMSMAMPMPFALSPDPAAGRAFYKANCSTCHGLHGDGKGPRAKFIRPPPRNFLSAMARQRYNRPTLFRAIALGKPGTVMPAWSKVLDEQQIANVAEFVFTTFIVPGAPSDTLGDIKKKP